MKFPSLRIESPRQHRTVLIILGSLFIALMVNMLLVDAWRAVGALLIVVVETGLLAARSATRRGKPPITVEVMDAYIAVNNPARWAAGQQVVDEIAARMGVRGRVRLVPDVTGKFGEFSACRYSKEYAEVYVSPHAFGDFMFLTEEENYWSFAHEVAHVQLPWRRGIGWTRWDGILHLFAPMLATGTALLVLLGVTAVSGVISGWGAVWAGVAAAVAGVGVYASATVGSAVLSRREELRADREATLLVGADSVVIVDGILAKMPKRGRWAWWTRTHPDKPERLTQVEAVCALSTIVGAGGR